MRELTHIVLCVQDFAIGIKLATEYLEYMRFMKHWVSPTMSPLIGRVNREARDVAQSYTRDNITICHNLAFMVRDMREPIDRVDESLVW